MKKYIISCVVSCLLCFAGCDSALEKYPLDTPSSSTYPSNETELKMAMWGAYASLWSGINYNMTVTALLDCATDIGWERAWTPLQSLGNGSQDANNEFASTVWRNLYRGISRCNYILDNMERAKANTSTDVYNQVEGEARFLRAYYYLLLTEFWGDVPLVIKTLKLEEATMAKTSKAEIVEFILTEFDEAAKKLPVHIDEANSGRAGKGAALAFKARAALYNGKWSIAAEAAKAVMEMNEYELHPNFEELFLSSSQPGIKELIFFIPYKDGYQTTTAPQGITSRMGGGYSSKIPTQAMVDSYDCTDGLSIDKSPLFNPEKPFENRDPRMGYTIAVPGSVYMGFQFETHKDSVECWNYKVTPARRVANQDALNPYATFSGYIWRKYSQLSKPEELTRCETAFIMMRYADVLLMYAEAKIELNQIDASVYAAVNSVRQRPGVGMPAIEPGKSQAELRSILRKERKCELAFEGLRWFDIRRWGIAEKVMVGPLYGRPQRKYISIAPVIDENGTPDYSMVPDRNDMRIIELRVFNALRDKYWPVPRIELETNTALTQNPGY